MIVHPDFLDHWKTKKLIELAGDDPAAPLLMIRLWGYCQMQKQSVFEQIPNLAAICRSKLSTDHLLKIMLDAGFLRQEDGRLIVHQWENSNRILRSAWNNGKRHRGSQNEPTGSVQNVHRKEKMGYQKVTSRKADGNQPVIEIGPDEAEKNRKQFAHMLSDLSQKMRSGDSIGD